MVVAVVETEELAETEAAGAVAVDVEETRTMTSGCP